MQKQKLLLDVCCGPCSISAIEELNENNKEFDVLPYVNNSNISSNKEYEKRLINIKIVLEHYKLTSLITNIYDNKEWLDYVRGYENEPEGGKRCELCYRFRLEKAANQAKKNNIQIFTTTLTSGIMKDAEKINAIGKEIAQKNSLIFLEKDFKKNKGFEKSLEKCKKLNIYRQKYCGCEFSIRIKK